ncbi:KpsF/GutQ family sugar-phosphate isomerase [Bacillus sp. USDA818B3_A]|uniref:KpsF/GutQ family sugar-phosphate isomerase n=1 Tax=Bacillus sp. USDA818B3_A TaxID=2698834 RepID=UPI00136900C8|nr:KpsF/GutQ family sugar-phosphate isomerase [Bacillus sp. USDA818B3_A]
MVESLFTVNNHITTVKEVLEQEGQAIFNLIETVDQEISEVIETIHNCNGRIIVTGVGKSGLVGRKITATLASTGTPSLFLHPAEGLHGDLGMVTNSDIILALSNSGESEEVIKLIPSIKRIGAKLIAFVGNRASTLGNKADHILCIGKVKEACPLGLAPTTSTTLMLSLGDAVAIALLKARNFSSEHFAVFHPGGSLGKRLLFTVETIMEITKRNPTSLDNCTIQDIMFTMTKSGLGATSIINHDGKLVGIITDGDIRRRLAQGENFMELSVTDLYNKKPVTVRPNTLAVEALNTMENLKINVLPVVNNSDEPIAMIHLHDITKLGF